MYPILFTIGPFFVPTYYVFLVIGVGVGVGVVVKDARRLETPGGRITAFVIAVIPFAYLMGLVNGWLFNVDFNKALSTGRIVLSGGLVSFGAILGSLWMGMICARRLNLNIAESLDLFIPAWPLILGFLRIGCLLNGCCYGLETDGFLGVVLPGKWGEWALRYPTQIMLSIFNFALFAWLWPRRRRTAFEGELTLNYLMLYSLGRLGIDAFRALPRVLGPFSLHQLTSIMILLVSVIIYLRMRYSSDKSTA
jgi:phosphatidylglycerol:prolipoprotein diacylglycerol transferase